jgi:hypothetical protein
LSLNRKDEELQPKNKALPSLFENYIQQETVRAVNQPHNGPGDGTAASYSSQN